MHNMRLCNVEVDNIIIQDPVNETLAPSKPVLLTGVGTKNPSFVIKHKIVGCKSHHDV